MGPVTPRNKKGVPWSEEEDRYLIRNYNKETYSQIGNALGRSKISVDHRRQRLKLPRPDRTPEQYGVLTWSAEDLNFLQANFPELTLKQIGTVVGRSEMAVSKKAKKLGLANPRTRPVLKKSVDPWVRLQSLIEKCLDEDVRISQLVEALRSKGVAVSILLERPLEQSYIISALKVDLLTLEAQGGTE